MAILFGAIPTTKSFGGIIRLAGMVTLAAGAATIVDAGMTANTVIILTAQEGGVLTAGLLRVATRTNGVGFTINTANALDNAVVGYLTIEP